MAYKKQTFIDKSTRLKAEHLNHIESGIVNLEAGIVDLEGDVSNLEEDFSELEAGFSKLEESIADLMYEAIDITSFTNKIGTSYNNINYAEIGSEVGTVDLSWKVNKTPEKLTLDGVEIDPTLTSKTSPGPITADKTYTLKATDERGATDSMTTKVLFVKPMYYGTVTADTTIDEAMLRTHKQILRGSRPCNFTITPDADEYMFFALPESYGTPTITIDGWTYSWTGTAIEFTHLNGDTDTYYVYVSENPGGSTSKVYIT